MANLRLTVGKVHYIKHFTDSRFCKSLAANVLLIKDVG